MPWEEKTVAQMREEFINMVQQGNYSMTEICRQFGVSRKTGYKWLERYKAGEGLEDKSRAPLHQANKTSRETELLILSLREEHPAWGPRKLKRRLADLGYSGLPAVSTVAEILRRNGQISEQESRKHRPIKRFEKEQANELWQMDFKGQFPLMDGSQCFPLTLLDDHSRFRSALMRKPDRKGRMLATALSGCFIHTDFLTRFYATTANLGEVTVRAFLRWTSGLCSLAYCQFTSGRIIRRLRARKSDSI